MTVIAYRDGVMAADNGAWFDNSHATHCWASKLARGRDGVLYGICGDYAPAQQFLEWVRNGYEGLRPAPSLDKDGDSTFSILVARPGGGVELVTAAGIERFNSPYFAIGAGVQVALGAMWAGASAIKAVEAAIEHSAYARGRVQSINFFEGEK